MQPNVPYREGGAAHGGLPFPRAGMTGYIVATALVAATGTALPLTFLGKSLSGVWMSMKEGGTSMWLLLLLMPICPIVVAVLASLAIRGRNIPVAAIAGAALFSAPIAFVGTAFSLRRMGAIILGESIDPSQRMRIAFEGTQESLAALQYGAAICAFCLGAAAVGCAGIAASVDRARVGAASGAGWVAAIAFPAIGLLASVAIMIVKRSVGAAPGAVGLSLVSLVIVAVIAALAARAAPAFRNWHDPAESKRMLAAVLVAALASALALWLLDRSAMIGIQRLVLGACSGESVDPSQRARILMEGKSEASAFASVSAVHVVCALCAFIPAIFAGRGNGTHPFTTNGAIGLAVIALGALGFWGLDARAHGFIADVAATIHEQSFPVALPAVKDPGRFSGAQSAAVAVDKDGKVIGPRAAGLDADTFMVDRHTYAADKDARAQKVFALSASDHADRNSLEDHVDLVIAPDHAGADALPDAIDPDVRAMIAPEPHAMSFSVTLVLGRSESPSITFVDDATISVRSGHGPAQTVSLGSSFEKNLPAVLDSSYGVTDLYVNIRETTTVGALVRVVAASSTSYRAPTVHVRLAR